MYALKPKKKSTKYIPRQDNEKFIIDISLNFANKFFFLFIRSLKTI